MREVTSVVRTLETTAFGILEKYIEIGLMRLGG